MAGENSPINTDLHKRYIRSLDGENTSLEHLYTEPLRMGGYYWGLGALRLLGVDLTYPPTAYPCTLGNESGTKHSDKDDENIQQCPSPCEASTLSAAETTASASIFSSMDSKAVAEWVLSCQSPQGAFAPNVNHDQHITSTHYAVLVACLCGFLGRLDRDRIAGWVADRQNHDGSFCGDEWGEVDLRFSYCALSCLTIIDRLHMIDCEKAARFIKCCRNYDAAFGSVPGAESHAAYTFCAVAALALCARLDYVDKERLGQWLAERQLSASGGFNGRPEKAPDVCYSWWILSTLYIIRKESWIDHSALANFISNSQDLDTGGISDRPGDMSDVFHTFFGLGGLSLLSHRVAGSCVNEDGTSPWYSDLAPINPVYALPVAIVEKLGLPSIIS